MTDTQLAILAIIQGLTEFLPISSSGHLVLTPRIMGWADQGLTIDVAVHVGSLLAVLVYFYRDVVTLAHGTLKIIMFKSNSDSYLVWLLIVATLPVVGAGYALSHYGIADLIRAPENVLLIVGSATLGFGLLLWFGDSVGITVRRVSHLDFVDAIMLGLSQSLALIPGASRAGTTMTMARILAMERSEAARFSMLMSIPAILAAGTLKTKELMEIGNEVVWMDAALAASFAFIAAFVSIWAMMRWLRTNTMRPFVYYRIILGIGILTVYFGWITF